jgi:hypothetical protein
VIQARCISQQSLCVLYAILASPFENDRFAKKNYVAKLKGYSRRRTSWNCHWSAAPAGNWIDLRLRHCGVGKND